MDMLPIIPEIRVWIQTIAPIILIIIAILSLTQRNDEKLE